MAKYCHVKICCNMALKKPQMQKIFSFSYKCILLLINITIHIFLLLDQQQDIPLFFILLNERKSNIYETIDGKPILHFLVLTSEQPDVVKTIINLGADVNTEDSSGFSALYVLSSNHILGKQNVQFVFHFINVLFQNKNYMGCLKILYLITTHLYLLSYVKT